MEIPTYRPPGSPLAKAFGESDGYGRPPYETVPAAPWEPNSDALRLRLAKAAGSTPGNVAAMRVLKSQPPQRFVMGIAYPADRPDVGKALDGHRDVASAAVVEAAAHRWFLESRKAGLHHGDILGLPGGSGEGRLQIVESGIYRGPDWPTTDVSGRQVLVKAGDWLLGAILDPAAWAAAQAGQIDGWSPQGRATRTKLTAARRSELRRN